MLRNKTKVYRHPKNIRKKWRERQLDDGPKKANFAMD